MPTAVTEMLTAPIPPDPPRKRWTRAECSTLEAAGMFDQQPVELIEGELLLKTGRAALMSTLPLSCSAGLRPVLGAVLSMCTRQLTLLPKTIRQTSPSRMRLY